jgi:hypothetical protein
LHELAAYGEYDQPTTRIDQFTQVPPSNETLSAIRVVGRVCTDTAARRTASSTFCT